MPTQGEHAICRCFLSVALRVLGCARSLLARPAAPLRRCTFRVLMHERSASTELLHARRAGQLAARRTRQRAGCAAAPLPRGQPASGGRPPAGGGGRPPAGEGCCGGCWEGSASTARVL